jgi:hypothetical protein
VGGSTGGGGVGGGGRGYVCQYLLSHAIAIRVDSRRRRGEVESRVYVPFLLFAISACCCCFRVLFFVQCWTHRDEGGGGISRTGKITTTTRKRKRKSETTTNDRRRNKEIKRKGKREGNERMAGTERNGTRIAAANGKQDNPRRREPDGRTDGRGVTQHHRAAAVRLISLSLVSLVLKEEGNVKGTGQECV